MPSGKVTVELMGDGSLNDVFEAVVDATEESVTNALFVADTAVHERPTQEELARIAYLAEQMPPSPR